MSGWRDVTISAALAGPALVGQMDLPAVYDAGERNDPLERSALEVAQNVGTAFGEAVKGSADGEEAARAEPVPEPEYGEYSDSEDLADADDIQFESVEGLDIDELSDVADGADRGDGSAEGWA